MGSLEFRKQAQKAGVQTRNLMIKGFWLPQATTISTINLKPSIRVGITKILPRLEEVEELQDRQMCDKDWQPHNGRDPR